MARRPPALNRSLASVADALVASGVMFLVQLALIWFATKEDYGAYSLLMSYVLAGQAALSAIFGAPLITAASALPDDRRAAALASATRWHLLGTLAIGAGGMALASIVAPGLGMAESAAMAGAFVGLALRDIQRVSWAIEHRLDHALGSSLVFGAIAVFILALAQIWFGALSSFAGLCAVAVAALASTAGPIARRLIGQGKSGRTAVAEAAGHARWTLPGVVVIWVQNNFYLTVLTVLAGLAAVAEVSAARMLAIPFLLATGALLRLNQVDLGGLLGGGRALEGLAIARRKGAQYLAWGLGLAALAGLAAALVPAGLLSDDYPDLLGLAALWFLFVGIASARGALSSLMQAAGRYRSLLFVNLSTIPVAILGLFTLIPVAGAAGAVVPLIVAELQFTLMLLWLTGRQFSWRAMPAE